MSTFARNKRQVFSQTFLPEKNYVIKKFRANKRGSSICSTITSILIKRNAPFLIDKIWLYNNVSKFSSYRTKVDTGLYPHTLIQQHNLQSISKTKDVIHLVLWFIIWARILISTEITRFSTSPFHVLLVSVVVITESQLCQ